MRRYLSCFPKALLEVKEITGTRHATGQRNRRDEKLIFLGNSFVALPGLSDFVFECAAWKELLQNQLCSLKRLWLRLLSHNYPLFVRGVGPVWCGADFLHKQEGAKHLQAPHDETLERVSAAIPLRSPDCLTRPARVGERKTFGQFLKLIEMLFAATIWNPCKRIRIK